MKNMKFRVNSPEHSEEIQLHLFRIGYTWELIGNVINPKANFLFANDGKITYLSNSIMDMATFSNHHYTETTLEELKTM